MTHGEDVGAGEESTEDVGRYGEAPEEVEEEERERMSGGEMHQ